MNKNKHIIEKIFLEIDTNSLKVANSLKNNCAMFIQNELLSLLENELNALSIDENEILQIEKLDISVSTDKNNADFASNSELKAALKKQIIISLNNALQQSKIKTKIDDVEPNTIISGKEKDNNTLIYFLIHGEMPWWVLKSDKSIFNYKNLSEIVLTKDFKTQFEAIIDKKIIRKRVFNQFTNNQIALLVSSLKSSKMDENSVVENKIIQKLATQNVDFKERFWTFILDNLKASDDKNIVLFYFENLKNWQLSFCDYVSQINQLIPVNKNLLFLSSAKNKEAISNKTSRKIDEDKSISEIIKDLEIKNDSLLQNKHDENTTITSTIDTSQNSIPFESNKKEELKITNEQKEEENKINSQVKKENDKNTEGIEFLENKELSENDSIDHEKKINLNKENENEKAIESNKNSLNNIVTSNKEIEKFEDDISSSNPTKKAYYVENAGLILLHPFIKNLFKNCNLLDEKNAIIDKELAVHILHYVATKEEHAYEHTMLFEKFLCGIPIQYPIKREITIEAYQKVHIEELLISVVEHWSALKNSSTAILRTEFLQREGKLDIFDANPKLSIEKKTQDILLDKIPWNISIVKIPWIEKLIYTEW